MTESMYGVDGTIQNGVFFTESPLGGGRNLGRIRVEISRQNANLTKVKQRLAKEATARGATIIANFRYGQRAHKWWEQAFTFKWDSESWYGEGDAIQM